MSSEMYSQLVRQVQILDYAEKLEMLSIITSSLKAERITTKTDSAEEKIKKLASFKGCIKGVWAEDALDYQNSLREDRRVV